MHATGTHQKYVQRSVKKISEGKKYVLEKKINYMNKLETTKQNTSLENIGDLSVADVLRHFNKNIYPQIKERFFSKPIQTIPVQTKKSIFNIFKREPKEEKKPEQTREERHEQNKKDSLINQLF
ncbi:TPA: hypothetical protein DCZ39_04295 [Patescibacteria group bacterium]|nr:hypothetical protein [Candidatus Gracilibacteria bacterium]